MQRFFKFQHNLIFIVLGEYHTDLVSLSKPLHDQNVLQFMSQHSILNCHASWTLSSEKTLGWNLRLLYHKV